RLVSTSENETNALKAKPVLVVNDTATGAEQGMLGVAISNSANQSSVFVYLTENQSGSIRNRVYQYSYNDQLHSLENETKILDLPAEPGPYHNAGKMAIGPDGYLYVVIGDLSSGGGL